MIIFSQDRTKLIGDGMMVSYEFRKGSHCVVYLDLNSNHEEIIAEFDTMQTCLDMIIVIKNEYVKGSKDCIIATQQEWEEAIKKHKEKENK